MLIRPVIMFVVMATYMKLIFYIKSMNMCSSFHALVISPGYSGGRIIVCSGFSELQNEEPKGFLPGTPSKLMLVRVFVKEC